MPRYSVIYEVVEKYDATVEGEFDYHSLRAEIENGHYLDSLDRSWREGGIRVIDVWEEKND